MSFGGTAGATTTTTTVAAAQDPWTQKTRYCYYSNTRTHHLPLPLYPLTPLHTDRIYCIYSMYPTDPLLPSLPPSPPPTPPPLYRRSEGMARPPAPPTSPWASPFSRSSSRRAWCPSTSTASGAMHRWINTHTPSRGIEGYFI